MLERRDDVRRDTHVEEQGSRHLFAHDEATCIVCAVRTMVGGVPTAPTSLVAASARGVIEVAYAVVVPPAGPALDNQSRAPPVLG